jgi:hypothetical protein
MQRIAVGNQAQLMVMSYLLSGETTQRRRRR